MNQFVMDNTNQAFISGKENAISEFSRKWNLINMNQDCISGKEKTIIDFAYGLKKSR
jgi:hypothetical protein